MNARANDLAGPALMRYHLPLHVAQAWATVRESDARRQLLGEHADELEVVHGFQRDAIDLGPSMDRESTGTFIRWI